MITAFSGVSAATTHNVDNFSNTYGAVLVLEVTQTAGAGSDTVIVEASLSGDDWTALTGTDLSDGSADNAPAATGLWRFDVTGLPKLRIRKTGTTDTFTARYSYTIA